MHTTACKQCILVANGYDERELGLDSLDFTMAMNYRIDFTGEQTSELGLCWFCDRTAEVVEVTFEKF